MKIRTVYGTPNNDIKKDEKPSDAKEDGENSAEKKGDSLNIDSKILERAIGLFSSEIESDKKLSTYYPNSVNGKKNKLSINFGCRFQKGIVSGIIRRRHAGGSRS